MGLFSSIGKIGGSILGGAVGGPLGASIGGGLGGAIFGGGDSRAPGAPGSALMGGPQYTFQQYQREKVLPDYLQQPYEDTVGAVMGAGTQPFQPYSHQFRPELFSPDEMRAQELYRGIPDKYSPYIQGGLDVVGESQRMALQGPSESLIQGYMNPFIGQVLDVQQRRALEDFQNQRRGLRSQAGQVGSFGGSRFGIAEGQLFDDYRQRQDQMESQLLMAGYDRALSGVERGLERGMDPRFLGGMQGIDLQGIQALDLSGEKQYLRDYGEFIREISDPMLKAGFLSSNIQPLAATVMGERGTSLGYSDPNLGSIGEGLAFGSSVGGLFGDTFQQGLGNTIGNIAFDVFGNRLGLPEDFGYEGGQTGTPPVPNMRPTLTNPFYNRGGKVYGYQQGGSVSPFDIYLNAASSGAGFVNPTPFSAWPDAPFGLGGIGATGDSTPSGGLLQAIEQMQKEEAPAPETDEEQGSGETEGKEIPGPESEGLLEILLGGILGGFGEGLGQFNEGGRIPRKPYSKDDFTEFQRMIEQGKYSDLAEKLNQSIPENYSLDGNPVGNLDGTDVQRLLNSLEAAPPLPQRRPGSQGIQLNQNKGQQENEGFLKSIGNWVKENPVEAAGWGLMALPQTGTALRFGKGLLGLTGKGLKVSPKVATKTGSLIRKYPRISSTLAGAGLLAATQKPEPLEQAAEQTQQVEQLLESLKKEATQPQTGREVLTLPGTSIPNRGDVRKDLLTALGGAKRQEGVNRSALLAFGASLSQGGGFINAFPRAAKAYSDAIASQESVKFKKQKDLLELENEMYQKELNRSGQQIAAQAAQLKAALLPLQVETEHYKARKALAEGTDKSKEELNRASARQKRAEAAWIESMLGDGVVDEGEQEALKDYRDQWRIVE